MSDCIDLVRLCKLAFPNHNQPPAQFLQRPVIVGIPLLGALKLRHPVICPGLWNPPMPASIVLVPKAPPDLDCHSISNKDNVRRSGQITPAKPVSKT